MKVWRRLAGLIRAEAMAALVRWRDLATSEREAEHAAATRLTEPTPPPGGLIPHGAGAPRVVPKSRD